MRPLATLVAMYIGVKLFSIAGFFLGPIGLVIITTVYKVLNEKAEEVAINRDISYNESEDQSL
jgi:predicted PurR-regulated permease PerM